ncbi:MAG: twin-arginine translocation signal domain-containing protein, partial [Coriobacteriaceae bacterium]|nr:twin-arginine translocation signal domain-containing protein [Coriobacteriaceae bacterium]
MSEHASGGLLSRRTLLKAAGALGAASAVGMTSTGTWLREAKADAPTEPDERVSYTYHNEHCLCNCVLQCTVRDGRLVMVQPRPNEDKRFENVCL